ncbi:GNAT family N-acetyltransferase [Brevibacillus centrosporus]|uniref:GNAT family N-acetyltransferase n=1 Tax=Brevibacillus centrosporus TaxID=54910 RepID=UPI003985A55C
MEWQTFTRAVDALEKAKASWNSGHHFMVSRLKKPLSRRKNGYASTCVAILSQQLLDAGYQFCSLYTDLANPTSNRIYQAIGYLPIQDSVVLRFDR